MQTIHDHRQYTDAEFEDLFASAKMDPGIFSHEAHLRLAWLKLRKHGLDGAIETVRDQLQHFVAAVGARDKYHETLTVAAVHAVHHFMRKGDHKTFSEFIENNPELKTHFKQLISSHYSMDIFASPNARTQFVQPDLSPFD